MRGLLHCPACASAGPLLPAARGTRVTPACAYPCPVLRCSRSAAPSREACTGPAAHVRLARRLSAPAVRARTCSGAQFIVRVSQAAAVARRTRARALPRRTAPPVCALDCGCSLLTGLRTVHLRARLGNVKTDYRCGSTSETAVACSLTHQCMFTQAANQECPPRIPIRRARQR